jgi:Carboxypeptidase regulatory-like domain
VATKYCFFNKHVLACLWRNHQAHLRYCEARIMKNQRNYQGPKMRLNPLCGLRIRKSPLTSCILILLSLLLPVRSQAQDISGRLIGRVQDSTGAVIPGARVTALNSDTGIAANSVTGPDGNFAFESLQIGNYQITVDAVGFRQYQSSNNPIVAEKTATLNVSLQPGAATERVEVAGTATQVDTATPTIQDTLGTHQLESLPVIGRDARVNVELTQPGAVQAENGNNGTRVRVNGSRGATNGYQVDGTDAIQYLTGNAAPLPAVENLQEYSDITSNAGVEYGTSAGSQVSAIIKSGTNRLHGMVWTYFQNSAWNSTRGKAMAPEPRGRPEPNAGTEATWVAPSIFPISTTDTTKHSGLAPSNTPNPPSSTSSSWSSLPILNEPEISPTRASASLLLME